MSTSHLLAPLQIGPVTIANRLVMGPLAGYSCAPLRGITARIGAPGYCVTEMISAKDLIHRKVRPRRYLDRHPAESVVAYQLAGNDCDEIAKATAIVTEEGADIVDLNCGCPVRKIRGRGTGSKLLADPEKLHQFVLAMKQNTDCAVTVKIRIGEPVHDSDDLAVVQAIESAGADLITVHGRHWSERYDVASRNHAIARIKQHATVPVFANGDAKCPESVQNIVEETACDGVMVARAGVGDPWLFTRIKQQLQGDTIETTRLDVIGDTLIEHLNGLCDYEGDKLAVLQSRKLAKYYARTLPNRSEFVEAVQSIDSKDKVIELIKKTFQ